MSQAIELATPDGVLTFWGWIDWDGGEPSGMEGPYMHMVSPSGRILLHVESSGEARFGDDAPIPLLPGEYHLTLDGLYKDEEPVWLVPV